MMIVVWLTVVINKVVCFVDSNVGAHSLDGRCIDLDDVIIYSTLTAVKQYFCK